MKVWKTSPSWFKLDNYSNSIGFSAREWIQALFHRGWNFNDLKEFNPEVTRNNARQFFEDIKINPLLEVKQKHDGMKLPNGYQEKNANVQDLSQLRAYQFLINSRGRDKIENDIQLLQDIDLSLSRQDIRTRKKLSNLFEMYSYPVAPTSGKEFVHEGFLQINLLATDEQILKEFKDWLAEARSNSNNFIKRQFSSKDFLDWYKSRLLPYWDLKTIAKIENATIPFHVLGEVLFPEECDVDLTERMRKVTKRKSQYVFSPEVFNALSAQVRSEKCQEIISNKPQSE